jgi:hypothetical protein
MNVSVSSVEVLTVKYAEDLWALRDKRLDGKRSHTIKWVTILTYIYICEVFYATEIVRAKFD